MLFQYLLLMLGFLLVAIGLLQNGWALLLVWLGANFLVLGFAHMRGLHRIFGKANGALPWWSRISFFPLNCCTTIVWHFNRALSRAPAYVEVTPELTIGRRLLSSETAGEFENYIDLTAEFSEPLNIRSSPSYCSFPILDGNAPAPDELRKMLDRLRPGRTFIHCAQGFGRTGLFALALLLKRGEAKNIEEGLKILTAVRPGVRLNRQQRKCIESYAALSRIIQIK